MRLGWLSDIHLNFLDEGSARRFIAGLAGHQADAWVVTGDIGEARSLAGYLRLFSEESPVPTYINLGNHDFYGGAIETTTAALQTVVEAESRLVWLNATGLQLLADQVALVGDDGWADARHGNALTTPVMLNDFYRIADLRGLSRPELIRTLNRLGDEAAARLAPKLADAARSCRTVVVATHVPPYRQAAWHEGRPSDDDWAPWFTCRAVGEAIDACAQEHPATQFLVLCGHTHGSGSFSPLDNVIVHTAAADYGAPRVQRVFEFA
jgi:3',5'-cyclic AMP phosphodiesterase CpdA